MVNSISDCVVIGGGPAGLMCGLMLARAGAKVTVCEKHADFLRDFRGDTVHASTLAILDELGLASSFAALPQRAEQRLMIATDDGTFALADFRRLPGRHQEITFVPQWDLLDLLAAEAERYPGFTLLRRHEVTALLRTGSRVTGVVAHGPDSGEKTLPARLTIAADGRGSLLRSLGGLPLRSFGAPIGVLWFRLLARHSDDAMLALRLSAGAVAVLIPREGYWQCAFVVPKGAATALLADGAATLRDRFSRLVPPLADRAQGLGPEDVHLLDVRLDRLRRWSAPGLLAIGDAAHAMSPVGGVGINLAIQDAVAAANLLATPLHEGGDIDVLLPRLQRRRWLPTALTQTAQRQVHDRLLAPHLIGGPEAPATAGLPLPLRAVRRLPALSHLAGRALGIGLLPEHVRTGPPTS